MSRKTVFDRYVDKELKRPAVRAAYEKAQKLEWTPSMQVIFEGFVNDHLDGDFSSEAAHRLEEVMRGVRRLPRPKAP
jgi:hypothetical protein